MQLGMKPHVYVDLDETLVHVRNKALNGEHLNLWFRLYGLPALPKNPHAQRGRRKFQIVQIGSHSIRACRTVAFAQSSSFRGISRVARF
jgi:hypothetical protein